MALALARDGRLTIHVFHDERSASFAALGIGKATMWPSLLLCTSGTAAAQFHAAVVEAHQSAVPLVVLTADRPPELHGVGAPQTIDQQNLFGTAVRKFVDVGVPRAQESLSWRQFARDAVTVSRSVTPGPVHLNLPFREPLLGVASSLPPPVSDRVVPLQSAEVDPDDVARVGSLISGRRGIIVAGGGTGRGASDLALALGWPMFADVRSAARSESSCSVSAFDAIIRAEAFTSRHVPEFVVRLGEPPASKVLSQWSASCGAQVIQVNADGRMFDPERNATVTVTAALEEFCSQLAREVRTADATWLKSWMKAEAIAQGVLAGAKSTFCEPGIARTVMDQTRPGDHVVVSSSMPIRDIEWFSTSRDDVVVHSNRGANGIDGVVSTAVGVALATGARTTLYIGDVACVHDSNGLWNLAGRRANLRIVVTNNNGGSIFSFLPQASGVTPEEFELLFGTPHEVDFAALARAHGIRYQRVDSMEELESALDDDGPILVEAVTARDENVSIHSTLNSAVVSALGEVS